MKTIEEINKKIAEGKAVILTAEEVVKLSKEEGFKEIARKVDVVTTGTFAPMCSSGAFMNFGHTLPPMRMEKIKLGGVDVYGGIAAVDGYIGATQESDYDKTFGGGHIIELLIKGERVLLEAWGKGTDCYPGKYFKAYIDKDMINDFFLFNPRNAYQNYTAATNGSDKILYTYMGKLLPQYGNIIYSTSGELSPLLKDPKLLTMGIGTRIFLGGGIGYIAWYGTQFRNIVKENEYGVPLIASRTLALVGDAKKMSSEFIKGAYFKNYGVTLFVGVGVPIPVLDEEIAYYVSLPNSRIHTEIRDYSKIDKPLVKIVSYEELRSGYVEINGKKVKTSSLSSLKKARQIALVLKDWMESGHFFLTSAVEKLSEEGRLKNLAQVSFATEAMEESYMELKEKLVKTCFHCGACVSVCKYDALYFKGDEVLFEPVKCKECLICSDVCPEHLTLPYEKGLNNKFESTAY
ncbi:MAG: homocysteine biosynthesis protein [Fervidobacterium sp.]